MANLITQSLVELKNRAVLVVSGADARDFLNGIITNDIAGTDIEGTAVYAGLLSPQGKLLFDFFIVRKKDEYWFDISSGARDDLIKRLTFYKLRAAVSIRAEPDAMVYALPQNLPTAPTDGEHSPLGALLARQPDTALEKVKSQTLSYADPRTHAMGLRLMILGGVENNAAMENTTRWHNSWLQRRLICGLPEAPDDFTYGSCFAHDIAMDLLNGISFSKGCYVGQEVVSRMQHRGTARTRPMLLVFKQAVVSSPAGAKISTAKGGLIGRVGSGYENMCIALVRLDRAAKALAESENIEDYPFHVETEDGVCFAKLKRPFWADYGENGAPFEQWVDPSQSRQEDE